MRARPFSVRTREGILKKSVIGGCPLCLEGRLMSQRMCFLYFLYWTARGGGGEARGREKERDSGWRKSKGNKRQDENKGEMIKCPTKRWLREGYVFFLSFSQLLFQSDHPSHPKRSFYERFFFSLSLLLFSSFFSSSSPSLNPKTTLNSPSDDTQGVSTASGVSPLTSSYNESLNFRLKKGRDAHQHRRLFRPDDLGRGRVGAKFEILAWRLLLKKKRKKK